MIRVRRHTPRHMAGRRPDPPQGDGGGAGAPAHVGGGDRPRRGGWVLPAVLAAVTIGAGAGAVALDADPVADATGVDRVVATPVLSARRAPEVVASPVADRRLAGELESWLEDSPEDSCLVVEAQGREVLAHNADLPLTGASTQKLLTATGLLLAHGPDATFTTEVVAEAPPAGGVVAGDLYVIGGGPADLGTPDWPEMAPGTRQRVVHDVDELVAAISAAGVTRVEGSVVGDGSRYDDQRYEETLAERLVHQDQVGPIGALMVNDGFARFSPERTNASTVPADDPAADAARVITERLEANGIEVAGAPRAGTAPEGATPVASLPSPPVSQLVAEMLTTSDNEAAEAMLKEIGATEAGEGSWDAGAAALESLLAEAGVSTDGLDVVDGSGLSIANVLTCATLVDVLTLEGTGPVVREGLPVAGETGTLADRWTDSEVAGRLRAKTGTLRNVTALAGEVETLSGTAITFAYVANVPDPQQITAEEVGLDELAEILVRHPGDLDLAALEPEAPATG